MKFFKNLIFGLLFLSLISNSKIHSQECETYKVIKIDSTENHFLVSLEKSNEKMLVVSSKRKTRAKRKIVLSQNYNFKLVDHKWQEKFPIDIPSSLVIDGKTIWKSEDDFKVYVTKNLKGLNYIKKCSCPN